VLVEPRQQRVSLRRHTGEVQLLDSARLSISPGQPLPIRITFVETRFRVFVRNETEPVLDVTDSWPILGNGLVGIRTSGAPLNLEHLRVQAQDGPTALVEPDDLAGLNHSGRDASDDRARLTGDARAWQAFCLVLLNLNEFAYVD